jgi:hypothetical protein
MGATPAPNFLSLSLRKFLSETDNRYLLLRRLNVDENPDPLLRPATRKLIALAKIQRDRSTQGRVKMDADRVEDLAVVLENGGEFKDDVEVYDDGWVYWLADGFHPCDAYEKVEREKVWALVREGTHWHAMIHASGANSDHGLPRSREDVQKSIQNLLEDATAGKWSGHTISKIVRCDNKTVEAVREKLGLVRDKVTRVDKHGNTGEMDVTGHRGRKSKLPEGQTYFFSSLPPLARQALKDVLFVAGALKAKQYDFLRGWLIDHLPAKVGEVDRVLAELEKEEGDGGDEPAKDKPEE